MLSGSEGSMANYTFETITAAQALSVGSEDSLTITSGSGRTTTVIFQQDGTFAVTIADRTVVFGSQFQFLNGSRLRYPDNSELYIGGAGADVRDFGNIPTAGGGAYGGAGDDTLSTSPAAWLVQGNQGSDVITARAGWSNTIYGGQDNDRISFLLSAADQPQFVQGNRGNDNIQGAFGGDTLLGGQGLDQINGGGGRDFINGNLGDDIITGAGTLLGEGGNDTISVGDDSTASGGEGDDHITISLPSGAIPPMTVVHGDAGNDTLVATTGPRDQLYGDDGNDRIAIIQDSSFGAVSLGKLLDGGVGDDTLIARGGEDTLLGGDGSDSLSGGDSADRIVGGAGPDTLAGGAGADRFELTSTTTLLTDAGADRILDWSSEDRLVFRGPGQPYSETTATDFASALTAAQGLISGGAAEVVAVQVGADVIVFADASAGTSVDVAAMLVGRTLADISGANIG